MPEPAAVLGPAEYIVIRFEGDRFTGDIVPALNALLDQGLVRLIDVAVVSKAPDGAVSIIETQELAPEVAYSISRTFPPMSRAMDEISRLSSDLISKPTRFSTQPVLPRRSRHHFTRGAQCNHAPQTRRAHRPTG